MKTLCNEEQIARASVRGVRIFATAVAADEPEEEQAKALTEDELRALLEATPAEWRLFVEFLAHTGLRIGEAVALRWSEIDFGRRRVLVRRRAKGTAADEAPVFPSRSGGYLDASNVAARVFKPEAAEAGVPWAHFHTLRHTCATMLFRSGLNAKQVQVWLGHHSPAFTLATYVHLLDDDLPDPTFLDGVTRSGATQVATRPTENDQDAAPVNGAETVEVPAVPRHAETVAASSLSQGRRFNPCTAHCVAVVRGRSPRTGGKGLGARSARPRSGPRRGFGGTCEVPPTPARAAIPATKEIRDPRSKVRGFAQLPGGSLATPDVQSPPEDQGPYADEIERLRLLLEASSTILGSLKVEDVLPKVLELARTTLAADAYALWRYDDERGDWDIAAHSGLSPEYVRAASEAIRENTSVISFEEPIVAEDIATTEWLTPAQRTAHAAEGTKSMFAVALFYGGRILGTLTFYYRDPHRFTEAEKSAASLIANLAAAALGTAEHYEAQRRHADDQTFVAEASALLASSLDYEETLANVAKLAVPRFADWCTIDMVQADGSVRRLTVAHLDPEKVRWAHELAEKYPPDPNAAYGVASVIRSGKPELQSEIPEELLASATQERPELRDILQELGLKSSMSVPLIARDRTLGAITFVSAERGRRYDESDLATAEDLARHAATAVDNAQLFREAEAARLESQEALAVVDAVFAAAPIGLAFMDTSFRYIRVNAALAAINGLPVEEHFGRTLRDVLGDRLADEVEPLHRQVLQTGEPILDRQVKGTTAAEPGEIKDWLVSYYPVHNTWGDAIGVGVVLTDVTDREQAWAAAEAANARLSVLAEASQQLASTLDYETTLANVAALLVPQFADWYAVDVLDDEGAFRRIAIVHKDPAKKEVVERALLVTGGDPDEPEGPGRVVRTGEPALYESISEELLRSSTRDEEHYEVLQDLGMESAMVVPLTAGGRTFGSLMLVSADPGRIYTEDDLEFARHLGRRAAVAVDNARLYRAAEEQARSALVVEHVADGVMLIDEEGVIRLWNPAAEQITGLAASEAVGRPAEQVFGSWEAVAELAQAGELRPYTHPVEVDGRELWLSFTGVGFAEGSVYAFRDLTAERAVEALKSDFVSTVSHELRTPLAAIYGAALTLRRDDVRLGEPQRSGLLEVIASESDRLARIVNDILWASRLESGGMQTNLERCDGVELARTVVDAARHYIPPSIELNLTAPEETPLIAADPDKARQVLTNLVDNAVKYSPDGGRVNVDVTVEGPRLRFAVRDEGLGVPPSEHRRIFEKFYRLDPDLTRGVGGTGLGLYISRELLERMGGRIWIESSGTGGSTFVAELPLAA